MYAPPTNYLNSCALVLARLERTRFTLVTRKFRESECIRSVLYMYICLFRVQCEAGSYSVGNQSSCTLCPRGSSCPSNSDHPLPCFPGTYSLAGAVNCSICDAGHQCANPTSECKIKVTDHCHNHSTTLCELVVRMHSILTVIEYFMCSRPNMYMYMYARICYDCINCYVLPNT